MKFESTQEKGKVKIGMTKYVQEIITEFPERIVGTAATPAANHLFSVNEQGKKLPEEMSRDFHHTVAKLLFLCRRARPDIMTAVAFLTTWVKEPDEDDWIKLVRVLNIYGGCSS